MTEEIAKPGPEPERLKLPHENWEDAVREMLDKKKPPEGFSEGDEDVELTESEG